MTHPNSALGGKLPTLLYSTIRARHREIVALEARPEVSQRQKAALLRISTGTYAKIQALGPDFFARVEAAQTSGNWSVIEAELFGRRENYHLLPCYKKVMKQLSAPPGPKRDNPPQVRKQPKPRAPDTTLTHVQRWLMLGEAAERFLTAEAVDLLLRARR